MGHIEFIVGLFIRTGTFETENKVLNNLNGGIMKSIKVVNFKSFEEIDVKLRKFNVLIGANASGKSNFISVFRFIRDIAQSGLENAISLQGGIEYLRNMKVGASRNMTIKIVSDAKFGRVVRRNGKLLGIENEETIYEFSLKCYKRRSSYRVEQDRLIQKLKFFNLHDRNGKKLEKGELIGEGQITVWKSNGKFKIRLEKDRNVELDEDTFFPPFFKEIDFPHNTLLLETPFMYFPVREIFTDISIFDFDPKLPKKAAPITGKAQLEEDGSNLSIVLKNILADKDKRRKLLNLLQYFLPFVESIDVEKFADKSLLFKLKESYFEKEFIPASLISDGTINITALIIALHFEKNPLVIIEEPERNIHPSLISKVVEMIKDASQKKQILITTHNPEVIKYVDIDDLLLISRDENGFSRITRPADKDVLKAFLENEIGVEELFVQNLLEI